MEMERVKQLQDQFKASDKLEKNVKTLTEKQNLVSLTFAVNGDQLVGFGNAQAIDGLKDLRNTDPAHLEALLNSLKTILTKPRLLVKSSFKTTLKMKLPKIGCQFRGRHWTEGKCRAYTQLGLLLYGFGQGGDKCYKLEFIPEWWPDGIDFVSFLGPSNASKDQNEAILQAMYAFEGLDINAYHDREDSPVREKKKTKKTAKAPAVNETFNDDINDLGEEMEEEQGLNFFKKQENSPKISQRMSKQLSVVKTLAIQEGNQEMSRKEAAEDSSDAGNSRDISTDALENTLALEDELGSQPGGEEEDRENKYESIKNTSNQKENVNIINQESSDSDEEEVGVSSKAEKKKSLDDSVVVTFGTRNMMNQISQNED